MNKNDFDLIKNIANDIGEEEYIKLKNPENLSDESGKSPIFEFFNDCEIMEDCDRKIKGVYFSTDNCSAGCAIFKGLTNKEVDTVIENIDDEDKEMEFVGFTIGVEVENVNLHSKDADLRTATIALTMEDEDGLHDILHEDIDNCTNIIMKETKSVLYSCPVYFES